MAIVNLAISLLVTLLYYLWLIKCQTPVGGPQTAARPIPVRPQDQVPVEVEQEDHPNDDDADLSTVLRETLASNNSDIQKGIADMMDMVAVSHETGIDYDLSMPDSSDESDSDTSIGGDGRRKNTLNKTKTSNVTYTKFGNVRMDFSKYNEGHFERDWNYTHNVKGRIRTFRYKICDRRYLRNICQYNLIKMFHDVCHKFKCSVTVIERTWALAQWRCDEVLKKNNPHKVWNGTFHYYRNKKSRHPPPPVG